MLEELRSLNESQKKWVLIIATIIIMLIVLGVWVIYFNSIVIGTADQSAPSPATSTAIAVTPSAPVAAPATNGPGVWQDIKNDFGSFMNMFRKPSQYNIQPSQ